MIGFFKCLHSCSASQTRSANRHSLTSWDANRYFVKKSPVKFNASQNDLDIHKRQDLAVLIESSRVQGEGRIWSIAGSRPALVSLVDRCDGVFSAKYMTLFSFIREGSTYHHFSNPRWSAHEADEAGNLLIKLYGSIQNRNDVSPDHIQDLRRYWCTAI